MEKPIRNTFITILIITYLSHIANAYKVLLYPSNVKSHFLVFGELGKALLQGGHDVHMTVPTNAKLPYALHPDIKVYLYPVRQPEPFVGSDLYTLMQVRTIEASERGFFEWSRATLEQIDTMSSKTIEDCIDLLSNKYLMSQLIANQYDFMIYDVDEMACSAILSRELNVPKATICFPANPWVYRVPASFSVIPSIYSEFSDRMTFSERLRNLIMELYMMQQWYGSGGLETAAAFEGVYEKEIPSAAELLMNTELRFYQHNTVTHYPHPLMPNTIDIGDLMMREGEVITPEYSAVLNTTNSVVLMSLGSSLKYLPPHWEDKFCRAFNEIDQNITIIWKYSRKPQCELPVSVIIKSWFPQNDLLAHPNVKLFITHSGWNSYTEGAFHATPMILLPVLYDQPYNAVAAERKGLGIRLKTASFKPRELVDAIHNVLSNASYADNARLMSKMLRKREVSAKKKINHWIDFVITFGGESLRSSGFDLSLVEFLMLDVLAAISIIFVVTVVCLCYLGKFVITNLRHNSIVFQHKTKSE